MSKTEGKSTRELLEATRQLIIGVGLLDVVKIVLIIGLAIQLHNRDSSLDETHDQVIELKGFVDDLKTTTPEEQQQNQAVTRAVTLVPEIKGILCEKFPEARGCQ